MSNRQQPARNTLNKKYGNGWQAEIQEIISGASGGFLFGIPLLYTMEVWFIGSYVEPAILLCILAITFMIVLLINQIEGFRPQPSATISEAITETIETLAIGLTCAALVMIILQEINLQTSLTEALGKIVFEGIPFSVGVAFSRSLLTGEPQADLDHDNPNSQSGQQKSIVWKNTVADLIAAVIGALFVAFSIAPTDEVDMLAASASSGWLLIIMLASLLISYGIVFASKITNYQNRLQQSGIFQSPQSETIISYLVSLLVGILMLWFFHKLTFGDPWFMWLRYSIILGLPACIGGAAGRLAV
ncbi:TIGR02587 family membrane protein [Pleurocapsa sp. CCALA 161]|uniref:TIGR02587 family membrane protein n=1 Tax=Pleurocapsa sp. CCALA 161 TaxID=2107688 RepID=UPI000D058D1A|nr:TIGR02587 family membrane protein [Pleurocapsa sp. CCALA 161]PSB06282.1 TIGR02587 family membrane protein [Pleurocapsa sp. CCALA 161]